MGFFLDRYAGRSRSGVGSGRRKPTGLVRARCGTKGFAARRRQREAAFPGDAFPAIGEVKESALQLVLEKVQKAGVAVAEVDEGDWHAGRTERVGEAYKLRVNRNHAAAVRFVTIAHDGWDEEQAIPGCDETILEAALAEAVSSGTAWTLNGPTSCWKEDVPFTALDEEAELLPPPRMPAPSALTQDELPDAWTDGETNGAAMVRALSRKRRVAVLGGWFGRVSPRRCAADGWRLSPAAQRSSSIGLASGG